MILALDTSTAACTAALFEADGTPIARADERIGRGHSERLVPMIEAMIAGRRPTQILVGCGPGSFTGIRVALAAAHGMAIGWRAGLSGFSSLALIAAGAPGEGEVAVAMAGGHGELFVQTFARLPFSESGPLANLAPVQAAKIVDAQLVIGSGAAALVAVRGWGEALDGFPAAADVLRLPPALRSRDPNPVYARAPDARPKVTA